MAWTSLMTFTAGAVLTAAQLNTHLRDNLNETAPAKATAANQVFVSTGLNAIAARTPTETTIDTSETTTSTSFVALTSPGPAVTVTTGTKAIVITSVTVQNTINEFCLMSYQVTGSTTISATDATGIAHTSSTANATHQSSLVDLVTLNAGSNTFTAQYRVSGGTGTFLRRRILVIPL